MKKYSKKKGSYSPIVIIVCVLLIIYSISLFVPLLWGLLTTFKSSKDFGVIGGYNILGLPNPKYSANEIRFGNYKEVFSGFSVSTRVSFYTIAGKVNHSSKDNLLSLLLNTILYAGVGSAILAFVPAEVAYLCAKYKYKFSSILYGCALVVMVMPIVGAYPSEITLLRQLGLYDSLWGNWIQKFSFVGMYFFVYYAFYAGLSDTYIEAAEIDGASQLRVFVSIIIPLSVKMISTVMLIQFVQLWNDYQTPLLYMPTIPTIAYGIYHNTMMETSGNWQKAPLKITSCMILAIPVFIIFIFLKDKLMGNITMGGIKE